MSGPCPRDHSHSPVLKLTVNEVLRQFWPEYQSLYRPSPHQQRVAQALMDCRTGALGQSVWHCEQCGRHHWIPHSCGNRHCPNCQHAASAAWLQRQQKDLLPVTYFHLVFTLPHSLLPLLQQNRPALYQLLFAAATDTLREFARRTFKAELGITAILHTWGQTLCPHPHLHCLVTGGGLTPDKNWAGPKTDRYLFNVRALSQMFRGKFIAGLKQLHADKQLQFHDDLFLLRCRPRFELWLNQLCQHKWGVFAKRPFGGPAQVLHYLGRYTHRVAISNARLQFLDSQARTVTFAYRDYAQNGRTRQMTLPGRAFVHRFLQHVLPPGFTKIRHYGLLGNNRRQKMIPLARAALAAAGHQLQNQSQPPPTPARACPHCGGTQLRWVGRVDSQGQFRPRQTTPPTANSPYNDSS